MDGHEKFGRRGVRNVGRVLICVGIFVGLVGLFDSDLSTRERVYVGVGGLVIGGWGAVLYGLNSRRKDYYEHSPLSPWDSVN